MSEFVGVMDASELAPGEMKLVDVDGTDVVVANVEGAFVAFGGVCPHEEGPLNEGELDGDVVTCPWHFTQFNVRTGEVIDGLTDEAIPVYEVRVADGAVQVRVP